MTHANKHYSELFCIKSTCLFLSSQNNEASNITVKFQKLSATILLPSISICITHRDKKKLPLLGKSGRPYEEQYHKAHHTHWNI